VGGPLRGLGREIRVALLVEHPQRDPGDLPAGRRAFERHDVVAVHSPHRLADPVVGPDVGPHLEPVRALLHQARPGHVLGGVEARNQALPAFDERVCGQRLRLPGEELGVVGMHLVGEAGAHACPVELVDRVEHAGEHGGGIVA
jgi:hypothetical protein